ncbi:hypothetical protein D1823_06005 [Ruegeria sp. AD91A]|nr:hypothetical protein D1823_06005 [Ruegeria sp. AD91A]
MEHAIVISIAVTVFVVLVALLAWSRSKNEPQPKRGSHPGIGYRTIHANYDSGGPGGGHSTQYRVPKDPQDYAKAMMPKSKGNAK